MNLKKFYKRKPKNACEALEDWAAQDSNILDEYGAESFSTKQLLFLKRTYLAQTEHLQNQQKLLSWIAISSIGWAALGIVAYLLKAMLVAKIIFYCSPLTVIAWLGFLIFLHRQNAQVPKISERIYVIERELEKRRNVPFF